MKKLLNRLKIATAALLAAIFCLIYPMQTLSDAGIIKPQQESSVVYSQPEEIIFPVAGTRMRVLFI